jgi:prepilin peptidase dependent protein B
MNPQVNAFRNSGPGNPTRQAGETLIEALIALALSVMVISAMVVLMANTMGTATRIIKMSQLTDELRNVMSMVTRDVRRANYSANSAYCYANADCGLTGNIAPQFADISVANDDACIIFGLDRDFDGNAATDDAGGFRLVETNGIGRVEMWTGDNSLTCTTGNSWVAITDPDVIDVTTFTADDDDSFGASVTGSSGTTITNRTRRIHVQIEGELILDRRITRRIEDVIKVRNDLITTS